MLIKFLDGSSHEFANLRAASLYGANLYGADLCGADLCAANLRAANLRGANLYGANLYGADLCGADLRAANLRAASLRGANLYGANLCGADLCGADLRAANLRGAYLRAANLRDAKGLEQQSICPAGTLYGYKKLADNQVITLLIPTNAQRLNAYGSRKCRAEFAYVHEMKGVSQSRHDSAFKYRMGETVRPVEPFCDDQRIECASGIHFYITKEEAEAHE